MVAVKVVVEGSSVGSRVAVGWGVRISVGIWVGSGVKVEVRVGIIDAGLGEGEDVAVGLG
jgi:hypothetical protein